MSSIIYPIPASYSCMSRQQIWDMFSERERRMLELLNKADAQASGALVGNHQERDTKVLAALETLSNARSMLV